MKAIGSDFILLHVIIFMLIAYGIKLLSHVILLNNKINGIRKN